jgi:hypothetical protein
VTIVRPIKTGIIVSAGFQSSSWPPANEGFAVPNAKVLKVAYVNPVGRPKNHGSTMAFGGGRILTCFGQATP